MSNIYKVTAFNKNHWYDLACRAESRDEAHRRFDLYVNKELYYIGEGEYEDEIFRMDKSRPGEGNPDREEPHKSDYYYEIDYFSIAIDDEIEGHFNEDVKVLATGALVR